MNYKDLYDEINSAVWGQDEENPDGIIFQYHDPFHNRPGRAECEENLRIQHLFKKFADKLILDTKEENIAKILNLMCLFVGETWSQCDLIESDLAGTEYDPGYMFDGYKPEDAVEPVFDPMYEVITTRIKTDDFGKKVKQTESKIFTNLQSARNYLSYSTEYDRKSAEEYEEFLKADNLDTKFILKNTPDNFSTKNFVCKIKKIKKEV